MTFHLTCVHIILVRSVLLRGHFVGTLPFLRIALRVAMATMHFHIAQTGLFFGEHFGRIQWIPGNNLAPMKYCPWGAR